MQWGSELTKPAVNGQALIKGYTFPVTTLRAERYECVRSGLNKMRHDSVFSQVKVLIYDLWRVCANLSETQQEKTCCSFLLLVFCLWFRILFFSCGSCSSMSEASFDGITYLRLVQHSRYFQAVRHDTLFQIESNNERSRGFMQVPN